MIERKWPMSVVFTLLSIFILGSFLGTNGILIELPVLIDYLPEEWQLPAIYNLVSNLAIIGIILIVILRLFVPSKVYEIPVNLIIMSLSTTLMFILAFTWNKTTIIGNSLHSLCFLIISSLLSLMSHISSVTFTTYLDRYDDIYMNSYYVGEALTELIPASLGLGQAVGELNCFKNRTAQYLPPRFSVRTYFFSLAIFQLLALFAFIILCLSNANRRLSSMKDDGDHHHNPSTSLITKESKEDFINREFCLSYHGIYLFIVFWTNLLSYGVLPSLASYALNPYSNKVYRYTLIIAQLSYPCAILINILLPINVSRYRWLIYIVATAHTIFSIYIVVCATMSPCSPFISLANKFGSLLVALSYIFSALTYYYLRVQLGSHLQQTFSRRGLFWFGAFSQSGVFLGSIIIYILIVQFNIFHQRNPCVFYKC